MIVDSGAFMLMSALFLCQTLQDYIRDESQDPLQREYTKKKNNNHDDIIVIIIVIIICICIYVCVCIYIYTLHIYRERERDIDMYYCARLSKTTSETRPRMRAHTARPHPQ